MNKEKIINMIQYAFEKVPYYAIQLEYDAELKGIIHNLKNLNEIESAIEQIPVLEKESIQRDSERMISAEYIHLESKDVEMVSTSGSTGQCLAIAWNKQEMLKSMIPLCMERFRSYGIKPDDRFCYFYTLGTSYDSAVGNVYQEYGEQSLGFSKLNLTSDRMAEICRIIMEFKPVWMILQPSIAVLLCRCFEKNKFGKIESLKYIELTGEMITVDVRQDIQNVFGCSVASQYGCYEANSIAYECEYGNMHCLTGNVYTEVVDNEGKRVEDGTEGNIVITTLENHVMPFIRYKIGDQGILNHGTYCKCRSKGPILKLTSGRINDFAIMRDGTEINSYIFVRAIELVNIEYDNIIVQFQIVQKECDRFLVKFVLNENIIDEGIGERMVEDLFLESLKDERLYDTEFEFEYCDELLPEERTGKLRYFIGMEQRCIKKTNFSWNWKI